MCKRIVASLLFLVMTAFSGAAAQSPSNQPSVSGMEADASKNEKSRTRCSETGRASLRRCGRVPARTRTVRSSRFISSAPSNISRPIGSSSRSSTRPTPMAPCRSRGSIGGHMLWQGAHPIAQGAQKVDFVADESSGTGICRRPQQGRLGWIRAMGGQLTPEHIRKGLRPLSAPRKGPISSNTTSSTQLVDGSGFEDCEGLAHAGCCCPDLL